MFDKKWQFTEISNIEETNFNSSLRKFYEFKLNGLVRENIQNSLDAKLDNENPARVIIKTGEILKSEIPGLNEIKGHINSLEGQNEYTNETIIHMKKIINDEKNRYTKYISFEDQNTKGLEGAKNGQSLKKEDTWGIYAYNKGFHSQDDDKEKEAARGGSHGIGKIASNAASDIYTMFFSNCDKYNNKHIGGTIQLIEHEYNGFNYRSTGYFAKLENIGRNKTKFYPFENNFSDVFSKNTRGLKIIIPFLRESFTDSDSNNYEELNEEIIKSVCDSFFLAIINNKLEVVVNDQTIINKNSLDHFINKYYIKNIEEIKNEFTYLYYQTYNNNKPIIIQIEDKDKEIYNFDLYFNYDENIQTGRVAIIRSIGMKIEDMKIKGNVRKPFNALLIPRSSKEDLFLKFLENESHTKLSTDQINDPMLEKNAIRFINNIQRKITEFIDEAIRENNPVNELIDTKDILYTINADFKKSLEKKSEKVKVESKAGSNNNEKPKEKKYLKNDNKEKKKKEKSMQLKKVNPTKNAQNEDLDIYKADPDLVERIIIGSEEIINFDFTENEKLIDKESCNIFLSLIDGMGNEYKNEFNLTENYHTIIDISTGENCFFDDNKIKNIKIQNSKIKLKLKLKEKYNKSLKFIYYLEV